MIHFLFSIQFVLILAFGLSCGCYGFFVAVDKYKAMAIKMHADLAAIATAQQRPRIESAEAFIRSIRQFAQLATMAQPQNMLKRVMDDPALQRAIFVSKIGHDFRKATAHLNFDGIGSTMAFVPMSEPTISEPDDELQFMTHDELIAHEFKHGPGLFSGLVSELKRGTRREKNRSKKADKAARETADV